jgi:hypothetical protein
MMATCENEDCGKEFTPTRCYFTRQLSTICPDCESNEAEAAHWRAEIERCGGPAAFPEYFERTESGGWREKEKR